jgi:DNA-binding NarL/FixJ family response regulator
MRSITVLLADDHPIVREGFRKLLDTETDIAVVGEAQTGRQAVAMATKLLPDVVMMDIAMPLLNGLEATRQIRKACPLTKVLMLSAHSDPAYVEEAIEAGASGFLFKQSSATGLSRAIRDIHKGSLIFAPTIVRRILAERSSGRPVPPKKKSVGLTSRETEVLQLIAESKANKEVAVELGIGIKTVEKHREHLMLKIGVHDTAGLTRYAIASGIIECQPTTPAR